MKPANAGIGAPVADLLFKRDTFARRASQILPYYRSISWFDSIESLFYGDWSLLRILADQVVKVFRKHPRYTLRIQLPTTEMRNFLGLRHEFLTLLQLDCGSSLFGYVLGNSADQSDRSAFVLDRNRTREKDACFAGGGLEVQFVF